MKSPKWVSITVQCFCTGWFIDPDSSHPSCTIPRVNTEGERPLRRTHRGFQGTGLEVRHTLLTMIHQLELGHVATPNYKRGWEMSSSYLFEEKKQPAPVTWPINLEADPKARVWTTSPSLLGPVWPLSSTPFFWEMDSPTSKKKWLLRHSASLQGTDTAHRRNSCTILSNWQSCVLPSWVHHPGHPIQ